MKKQFTHSLSVRIIGLLLSFFIGTQPLMALAKKMVAAQEQTQNPLSGRLESTLLPLIYSKQGIDVFGRSLSQALMGYKTKPETRKNFLSPLVEENTHLLATLFFKQRKCITASGFVRTAYESLILNNEDTLKQKQNFIKALNPSEIDGALYKVQSAEELTLKLALENDEFPVPIDSRLIAQDTSFVHDVTSANSPWYAKTTKKIKRFILSHPLIVLGALYAGPALYAYKEIPKLKKIIGQEIFGETDPEDEMLRSIDFKNKEKAKKQIESFYKKHTSNNSFKLSEQNFGFLERMRKQQIKIAIAQGENLDDSSISTWLSNAQRSLELSAKGDTQAHNWGYLKGINANRAHGMGRIFSFAGVAWSLKTTLDMFKRYQNYLVSVAHSLNGAHDIYRYLQNNNLLHFLNDGEQKAFAHFFDKKEQSGNVKKLFSLLATATFKAPMTSFLTAGLPWHAGRIGSAATLLGDAKKEIQELFLAIGHVDYIAGLKKMIIESEDQKNQAQEPLKFSFVEFVDSATPLIDLKNTWFPLYGTNAVPTDVSLGDHAQPHHLLITGVNGTGKSGVMLSTLTSVMMGMTHGIAPAEHARMTPFANIHSHMNVGDDQGDGKSGYTNEMKLLSEMMARIQKNADANKERTKPEFFFVVQDETLRSTEKDNAYQVGWGLFNFLNNDPYTLSLCASHLYELTAIEKATNGNFKNAYVHSDVADGEDGYQIPVYTRKLKFGVNQVRGMALSIAFDALKKEGLLNPQIKALFATKPPQATA